MQPLCDHGQNWSTQSSQALLPLGSWLVLGVWGCSPVLWAGILNLSGEPGRCTGIILAPIIAPSHLLERSVVSGVCSENPGVLSFPGEGRQCSFSSGAAHLVPDPPIHLFPQHLKECCHWHTQPGFNFCFLKPQVCLAAEIMPLWSGGKISCSGREIFRFSCIT